MIPGMPGAPQPPSAPPGGTGAAMAPAPMAGMGRQGMAKAQMGLKALQESLSEIPMGSDLHAAILKAVTEVTKHMKQPEGGGDQNAIIQQLVALARQQGQPPQAQAMQGMFPGGGSPPPPGAGAPPPG